MSRRITPIAFMDSDRYVTWAEHRMKVLRKERRRRWAGYAAGIILPAIVAWVVVGAWLGGCQ